MPHPSRVGIDDPAFRTCKAKISGATDESGSTTNFELLGPLEMYLKVALEEQTGRLTYFHDQLELIAIQRYEQTYKISRRPIPWTPSRNHPLCNRLRYRGENSGVRFCQGSEGRAKAIIKVPPFIITDDSDKDTATDAR